MNKFTAFLILAIISAIALLTPLAIPLGHSLPLVKVINGIPMTLNNKDQYTYEVITPYHTDQTIPILKGESALDE